MRFPRRHLAALSIVCASALGCYSAGLPPRPAASSETLSLERLPWTVAIDDSGKPLPRLMQDLSRLFKHVGRLETDPNADLIITPGAPLEGEDPIPLWTLLSLGLIPTVIKEEYGHRFQLQAGRHHQHCADAPLDLDLTYATRSVGGWFALPMNLHPNRTSRNPHNTARFQVFLSQALLQRKQEMAKLVCGTTESGLLN